MASDEERGEINISKIPVRGGVGALALILILLGAMSAELPGIRWLAIGGTLVGAVFGIILIAWRRHRGGAGQ